MKFEIKRGARRRDGEGWVQIDKVLIDDKPIRGRIVSRGRGKRLHSEMTILGEQSVTGVDAYWLAAKNGLLKDEEDVL